MKTSELITALQASMAEHGDLPVGMNDLEWDGEYRPIGTPVATTAGCRDTVCDEGSRFVAINAEGWDA